MIDPPAPAEGQRAEAILRGIPPRAVHLCIDMQNLIGPSGPWAAEWAQQEFWSA